MSSFHAAQLSDGRDHNKRQGSSYKSPGMFNEAHNFVMQEPVFIDNSNISDNFMKELLQHTIIGAEFDSADRNPPQRCHPSTRLAIIKRCLDFIVQCHGEGKLRWVFGSVGVGKSAIMQIVAEETPADVTLGASIFFSDDGRKDGTKAIMTIAYQLAAKCESYHHFIRDEISRDPSLLRKSLPVQFHKFIVEPFMHQHLFDPSRRFLMLIDGLDECADPVTQQELLKLISGFCISYPTSPVVWIVASRPEPHLTSFFEKAEVQPTVTEEEIEIDSEEACKDVQLYLRDELRRVQLASTTLKHKREWPTKHEFDKIATAAGGLFAYASAVVQYISGPRLGGPAFRLSDVLEVIEAGSVPGRSRKDHPLAQLDALYAKLLSNIPLGVMANTRKLLLLLQHHALVWHKQNFRLMCNLLGLTEEAAYGAIHPMYSIMKVPAPDKVDERPLDYCHKSFQHYLCDFERSGFTYDVRAEAGELAAQISLRVVKEVPKDSDGMANGEGIKCENVGYLKGGPGACDNVSLSWPGDERFKVTDDELKRQLYCSAITTISKSFRSNHTAFMKMSCFRVLTTRFITPGDDFPFYAVRRSIFDTLNAELTKLGILKQVPLHTLDYAAVCGSINFRFRSPTRKGIVDLWNPSCRHRKQNVDGSQERYDWSTFFRRYQENDITSSEKSEDDAADPPIPRFNIVAALNAIIAVDGLPDI